MKRIVFAIVLVLGVLYSIPIIVFEKIKKDDLMFYRVFTRPFFTFMIKMIGGKVVIHGEVPHDLKKTMVVANHASLVDVLVLVSVFEDRLIFVSKKENRNFPIVSTWMKINKTVFIDRESVKQSIKDMKSVTEYLKEQENIAIFPQGSRNAENIDFKAGSLKFAARAEADILPVGLKGTGNIFKVFYKSNIDVYINDILKYEDYKEENLVIVQKGIQKQIEDQVL